MPEKTIEVEPERVVTRLLDHLPAMIAYIDSDYRHRATSRRYRLYFEADDVEGRTVAEVVGAEDFAAMRPRLERVMGGETLTVELPVRSSRPEGELAVKATFIADRGTTGEVRGCFVMACDSHAFFVGGDADDDQKRLAEQVAELEATRGALLLQIVELEQSEQRLAELEKTLRRKASLVEKVSDAIVATDTDQNITSWNLAAEALYGWTRAEVIGKSAVEILGSTPLGPPGESAAALAETGTWRGELHQKTREGKQLTVRASVSQLRDPRGDVEGFVGIVVDISDQKRLEARLRHAEKMEAVGRLAGGVAHDINNVLMGISGCADLALQRLAADHIARPFVLEVARAARGGADVPRRLLEFSRRREDRSESAEIDAVLAEIEPMVTRLVGEHITVRVEPGAAGVNVGITADRLEQVLMNLVLNARNAMHEGGSLTITTAVLSEVEWDERWVRLTVLDTGSGMDAETQNRAFEPFFTSRPDEGTGLGLSSVYAIVDRVHGYVELESEPGAGTEVMIMLPEVARPQLAESSAVRRRVVSPVRRTILLVEDDPLVRLTVRHYLQDAGFVVLETKDGDEAVRISQQHRGRIDALIADVQLPGRSGRAVADEILRLHPDVRVLFMSAHARETLLAQHRLSPESAELEKPFTRDQLTAAMFELLELGPAPDDEAEPEPSAPRVV